MDEKSKKLLGTATVAIASLGLASLPGNADPPTSVIVPIGGQSSTNFGRGSELFMQLMIRTGGSRSARALNRELRLMLSHMTLDHLLQVPSLIQGLKNLDLGSEVQGEVLATLLELIASSTLRIEKDQIERIAEALIAEPERAFLAKLGMPGQRSTSDLTLQSNVGLYGG